MRPHVVLLAALAAAPVAARAQPAENPAAVPTQPPVQAQAQPQEGPPPTGFWQRDTLTGNWGGLRDALKQQGVTVTLTDSADLLANLAGGIRTGTNLENALLGQVDADLGPLLGWPGAHARVSAFDYAGRGLTLYNVGSLMTVSGIEAPAPSARIWELWLEQSAAGGAVAARLGVIALDAAGFATTSVGALFVGSTFGFPDGMALDLPLGGPAYPLSAPGMLLTLKPAGTLSLMAGVLSGDPGGGPGATYPPEAYPTGTVFSTSGGALAVAQATLALNPGGTAPGLQATFKLGAWYDSSGRYIDLATANAPVPVRHPGDWGVWATAEGPLYRAPGGTDRGLSGFARVAVSPPPASLIDRYADAGLAWKGPFAGRDNDLAGLAVAYAHVGASAQAADRALQAADPLYPVRNSEVMLEATYQAAIAPWWTLQPEAQYWVHPGGNVPNPDGAPRRRAVVAGLRTQVTF